MTLKVERTDDNGAAAAAGVQLRVQAEGVPDSLRLTLIQAVVHIHLRNGATLRIPSPLPLAVELRPAPLPDASRLSWIKDNDHPLDGYIPLTMDSREKAAAAGGIASIEVEGLARATSPHVAAIMPLEEGATRTALARHLLITKWTHSPGEASLNVATSSIAPGEGAGSPVATGSVPEYALVNEARHEALPIVARTSGRHVRFLVLPGPDLWDGTADYEIRPSAGDKSTAKIDDAWLSAARLLIIDWKHSGSYSVHGEWIAPPPR